MNGNFFAKNTSLRLVICLILFIPLIIAIIFGLRVDPNTVTVNSLLSVSVSSPNGAKSLFSDEAVLKLYSSLSENAEEVNSSFRDFSAETPFTIVFSETNSEPIEYKLYVSESTDGYVYVSPDNKYFLIAPETAEKLVSRPELNYIDVATVLPVLNANGFGEPSMLSPESYDWTYASKDGSVSNLLVSSSGAKNPVLKFDDSEEGTLKLSFDKTPDAINLTIKRSDGTILFDDKYEKLSEANLIYFEHDEMLSANVLAEWYPIEGFDYHNKVSYSFDLLYDLAPTFKLVDRTTLPVGEFTVLRMTDFNDGELLTVTNEMGIPEKLNVYDLDEKTKVTFIPFGPQLEIKEYPVTVSTDLGQTFEFTAAPKYDKAHPDGFETEDIIINEETDKGLNEAFSKSSVEEFDALISQLTAASAGTILYDGAFVYPTGSSKIAEGGAEFGTRRKIYSLGSAGDVYISRGHDLKCNDGDEIVAANSGTVVYAGATTLLGNTVIIDHGFGILSCYGNLSDISVSVGDTVTKKSSVIGLAGSTGFACAQGETAATTKVMCHYAVSLNGVFVSPKSVSVGIFYD